MKISITLPISQEHIDRINEAGPGATIHHPRAASRPGRQQLSRALTFAGIDSRLVATLGWSTTGNPVEPEPANDKEPDVDDAEPLFGPLE